MTFNILMINSRFVSIFAYYFDKEILGKCSEFITAYAIISFVISTYVYCH